MTKIVILTGKAQSGKDTSCDHMIHSLLQQGYTAKKYSFAYHLKNFCVNVLGVPHENVWGTNEDKNKLTHLKWENTPWSFFERANLKEHLDAKDDVYMTGREVLQIFGTNICRHWYNDCWAVSTKKDIELDNLDFAFIADCRFPNEIDVFQDDNSYVIQLLRNPLNGRHLSETALETYDFSKVNHIVFDNTNISMEHKNDKLDIMLKDWIL